MLVAEGFPTVGVCPLFVFRGTELRTQLEEIARLRDAAERVARQLRARDLRRAVRREPIGHGAAGRHRPAGPGRVATPEDSVSIEDCQRVSRDLSAMLDVEDEFGCTTSGETYTLEVSSPGLDRPLRHEADYRRFAGRLAKIVTTRAGRAAERVRRTARAASTDGAVLLEEGRRRTGCRSTQIKRAQPGSGVLASDCELLD